MSDLSSSTTEALLAQANDFIATGAAAAAETLCRELIEERGEVPGALVALGQALIAQKNAEEAVGSFERAHRAAPDDPVILMILARTRASVGRIEGAVAAYRQALALGLETVPVLIELAALLAPQGLAEEALALYDRALKVDPGEVSAHINAANMLLGLGRTDEALERYQGALAIGPDRPEAHYNLGRLYQETGRLDEAIACYDQALALKPDLAEAQVNKGNCHLVRSQMVEAEAAYRLAVKLKPDLFEVYINWSLCLNNLQRWPEAMVMAKLAVTRWPDRPEGHIALGNALIGLGQPMTARPNFLRAIELAPDNLQVMAHLGHSASLTGDQDEARGWFERASARQPDNADLQSSLIFLLDFDPSDNLEAYLGARRREGARLTAQVQHLRQPHGNDRNGGRQIRVGYLSGDFRLHSSAVVVAPVLLNHDKSQVFVALYHTSAGRDSLTERYMATVDLFRPVSGLADEALAQLIRDDRIDILVDLSGYSAGNRLRCLAMRPAPIQGTAWGYLTGTGLDSVDFIFSDPIVIQPDERGLWIEKVIDLPFAFPYMPVDVPPAIEPYLRGLDSGPTFGCFNRMPKIWPSLPLLAKTLNAVPASRLIIKAREVVDPPVRDRLCERFAAFGVSSERLVLVGRTGTRQHIGMFNAVDVALDTAPHTGGVVTLEALSMGVPVVTRRGRIPVGRLSATILTQIGRADWIADDDETYVAIASRLAAQSDRSLAPREDLRGALFSSPLCNYPAYVRAVEGAYRGLWRDWCDRPAR